MALELAFKECGAKVKGFRVVSKGKNSASERSQGRYTVVVEELRFANYGQRSTLP